MPQTKRNEGAALFLALGYVTAVTLFASLFLASINRGIEGCTYREAEQQCMAIAEAGLEKALVALRRAPEAYRGEQDTALGAGAFNIAVTPGEQPGCYRIVSTGTLRDETDVYARARIEAEACLSADRALRALRWLEVSTK